MMRRVTVALVVLLLLPVLFIGAWGPINGAYRRDWIDYETFDRARVLYKPVDRWLWTGQGKVYDAYWRWHFMFDPPE